MTRLIESSLLQLTLGKANHDGIRKHSGAGFKDATRTAHPFPQIKSVVSYWVATHCIRPP